MDTENRTNLINYRLEQAQETISEAELLIAHKKYRAAVNRIYYGMFYAVSAVGAQCGFATSKHGQLLGWFNQMFIKPGIFDRTYGKMLREAFELRLQGDYDAFIEFSEADVRTRLKEMTLFINAIAQYLRQQQKPKDAIDEKTEGDYGVNGRNQG